MCTIVFSYKEKEDYPLVLAANRDEFYERPTREAHWWDDHPDLLGGLDQQAGGTWFGITRQGRFATLTNFRAFPLKRNAPSRGDLVKDFLLSDISPEAYLEDLKRKGKKYNGFNLLFGSPTDLWYYGNRDKDLSLAGQVNPGLHGLSNALLNSPWPKVEMAKKEIGGLFGRNEISEDLPHHAILESLFDTKTYADDLLPNTGIGIERERSLSALFIRIPENGYGTRTSWMLTVNREGKVNLIERQYKANPADSSDYDGWVKYSFEIEESPVAAK